MIGKYKQSVYDVSPRRSIQSQYDTNQHHPYRNHRYQQSININDSLRSIPNNRKLNSYQQNSHHLNSYQLNKRNSINSPQNQNNDFITKHNNQQHIRQQNQQKPLKVSFNYTHCKQCGKLTDSHKYIFLKHRKSLSPQLPHQQHKHIKQNNSNNNIDIQNIRKQYERYIEQQNIKLQQTINNLKQTINNLQQRLQTQISTIKTQLKQYHIKTQQLEQQLQIKTNQLNDQKQTNQQLRIQHDKQIQQLQNKQKQKQDSYRNQVNSLQNKVEQLQNIVYLKQQKLQQQQELVQNKQQQINTYRIQLQGLVQQLKQKYTKDQYYKLKKQYLNLQQNYENKTNKVQKYKKKLQKYQNQFMDLKNQLHKSNHDLSQYRDLYQQKNEELAKLRRMCSREIDAQFVNQYYELKIQELNQIISSRNQRIKQLKSNIKQLQHKIQQIGQTHICQTAIKTLQKQIDKQQTQVLARGGAIYDPVNKTVKEYFNGKVFQDQLIYQLQKENKKLIRKLSKYQ